jgi:predicted nucleic-acid-binding protein
MVGADTNVIIRFFVDDNLDQAMAARAFVEADDRIEDPLLITPVVMAEVEWSLRSNFKFAKHQILDAFDQLTSKIGVSIDDRHAVESAIEAWRGGKEDFTDYLIAALARERGARTTMTFDRGAAATAAFTLLAT